MQYARPRSKLERGIVYALRKAGAAVQRLDGPGIPNLLVSYNGELQLVVVKKPVKRAGAKHADGELTTTQARWWQSWRDSGGKPPVFVQSTLETLEALDIPLSKLANSQPSNTAATSGEE